MLTVENLGVSYGQVTAVREVSFSCAEGEILTLVGANGAGKSSTLLAVAGSAKAGIEGEISLGGRSLRRLSPEDRVAAGLALVPEKRRVLSTLSVEENLLVATAARRDRRAARGEVRGLMGRFPILGSRAGMSAGLLSGGEQQQLAIARALLARPKVLMLDEPSLGLAPQMIDEVFRILGELRAEGIAVVLVEQNARRAAALADLTLLLRQGRVAATVDGSDAGGLDAYFGLESAKEGGAT